MLVINPIPTDCIYKQAKKKKQIDTITYGSIPTLSICLKQRGRSRG